MLGVGVIKILNSYEIGQKEARTILVTFYLLMSRSYSLKPVPDVPGDQDRY